MSDETPRLRLAQLVSLQELNAVTWNEALAQLDALADLCLGGQYVNTPPAGPSDGDAYLVGGAPTGAWSGQPYKIASCLDGAWRFHTPFNGLRAYVTATGAFIVYVNGNWLDWNSLISASEASIASAATCDLGAAGSLFVQITGTTAITSFGTGANKLRFVRFAQGLTLTHNATSLILLGGVSRTTADGDVGVYASDTSGNWRERSYWRAAANPGDFATKSGSETLSNKTLAGGTFTGNLQFTDATYDIGANGQGRPRNINLSGSLSIAGSSNQTNVDDLNYTNYFQFRKRRATGGTLQNGDQLGAFIFQGYDGTTYRDGAYVRAKAESNYASGSAPTYMEFCVTPAGSGSASVRLHIASDGTSSFSGNVLPGSDNACNLGSASYRWAAGWIATAWTVGSGRRIKCNDRAPAAAEIAVAKRLWQLPKIYQLVMSVAAKGEAARLHTGMIYDEVRAVFVEEGLDPERYSIFCREQRMKKVAGTRPARRQKQQPVTRMVEEVRVVDGVALLCACEETANEPVFADMPVFGQATGRPVKNGDGTPRLHREAVLETYDEPYEALEPELDENGVAIFDEGLRYLELILFMMAGQAALDAEFAEQISGPRG
jgi:hypothetical protein